MCMKIIARNVLWGIDGSPVFAYLQNYCVVTLKPKWTFDVTKARQLTVDEATSIVSLIRDNNPSAINGICLG